MNTIDMETLTKEQVKWMLDTENHYFKGLLLKYFRKRGERVIVSLLSVEDWALSDKAKQMLQDTIKEHKLGLLRNINYKKPTEQTITNLAEEIALTKGGKVLKLNPKWELFMIKK